MARHARHGTRSKYVAGCRCEPCTVANRVYARDAGRRRARVGYGIEPPSPPRHVDATETREHIAWLRSQGVGSRTIMRQTGLARSTLRKIVNGERTLISPRTAQLVLAIGRHNAAARAYIDARRAHQLVAELQRQGHTVVSLSRRLGYRSRSLQLHDRITPAKLARIEHLYQQLNRSI